ncbi:Fe(3+)-hydroxamate ABC transporter permease FhuB [Mesorhizobium sp. SB112]|uniref:Fe(3+)-hydroxamate ABC transporter permease FhuB n=1 Tax=Mesorhizobium sp. SB112 TaxID=3151853 RepID=UPI003264ECBA
MGESATIAAPVDKSVALGVALIAVSLAFLFANLAGVVEVGEWSAALLGQDPQNLAHLTIRNVMLPRFAMALLCGGALGLGGVVFQQVLRNPLAEPGTLGVFAGAKCALALCLLWAPGFLDLGWDVVSFLGGGLATLVILLLAARQGFSPTSVILSGLILSLSLGAFGSMLVMVHFEALGDLFVWDSGSLVQNNWQGVLDLLPRLAFIFILTSLMARPLAILELDEGGARSLGVSLNVVRIAAIAVAVAACAIVAGSVGPISFIALAGAAIARGAGARRLSDRLIAGPLTAAGLLALTDQALLIVSGGMEIPAGAVTAVVGAPLLLWMLRRLRPQLETRNQHSNEKLKSYRAMILGGAVLAASLVVALGSALLIGRNPDGWFLATGATLETLMPWRLPRVIAALGAGMMLGMAGTFLQRLTGNEMASPELLGISSGAAFVLLIATLFLPQMDRSAMMLLSCLATGLVLWIVLWFSRGSANASTTMLLAGAAIGTLLSSVLSILMFLGDARMLRVMVWMAGSTYSVTASEAWLVLLSALAALAIVPLFTRWLTILPLGRPSAASLGVPPSRSRFLVVIATACMTGAATLFVGPLSFVGLMAPHMTRMANVRGPLAQTYVGALLGGILMVLADWLGRNVAFPWQIPAGLFATGIGGLYFIVAMLKR